MEEQEFAAMAGKDIEDKQHFQLSKMKNDISLGLLDCLAFESGYAFSKLYVLGQVISCL